MNNPEETAYTPISRLTELTIVFLFIFIFVTTIQVMFEGEILFMICKGPVSLEQSRTWIAQLTDSGEYFDVIQFIRNYLSIVTVALFTGWLFIARRNLDYFAIAGLRYNKWWAIGGFFIPIWNIFRPYQVVSEVWTASNPDYCQPDLEKAKKIKRSSRVRIWWGVCLGAVLTYSIPRRIFADVETLIEIQRHIAIDMTARILIIVAGLLTVSLVKQIWINQARMYTSGL